MLLFPNTTEYVEYNCSTSLQNATFHLYFAKTAQNTSKRFADSEKHVTRRS